MCIRDRVRNVRTSTNAIYPQYIKLAKETGLSVNNVTLPNVTVGYTVVPEATINITNICLLYTSNYRRDKKCIQSRKQNSV